MKDLLILGTGVHAAEMVEIVDRVNARSPTWNLLGLIAAKEALVGQSVNGAKVLGTAGAIAEHPEAMLVPENGWGQKIELPDDRFARLVDPSSFVSRTATIGPGCVIYPHCFVGHNASLGRRVFCLSGCIVNHDDVLGDRVILASGVRLAGCVRVEEDCYLGQGCCVREFLRIGRGSLIGMGAVVVEDVAPDSVMVGNPARKLRDRSART